MAKKSVNKRIAGPIDDLARTAEKAGNAQLLQGDLSPLNQERNESSVFKAIKKVKKNRSK